MDKYMDKEEDEESKEMVEESILKFIDVKCKEAASFFCLSKDSAVGNDTIMNNVTFYRQNPKVFELQSKIIKNVKNFNKFTPFEKAIWFGLEPTRENVNSIVNMPNITSLIEHNVQLIERAKLIIKDQKQKNKECIDDIHSQLKKGWASDNAAISRIYNDGDGLTPSFYNKIYDNIIYPKIQSRLKIHAKIRKIQYTPFINPNVKDRTFSSSNYSSISEKFSAPFYGLDKSDTSISEKFSVPFDGKGYKKRSTKRYKQKRQKSKKRR
jgi:hypothetical protein